MRNKFYLKEFQYFNGEHFVPTTNIAFSRLPYHHPVRKYLTHEQKVPPRQRILAKPLPWGN